MPAIHTILHPTDFSKYSDGALEFACALARDYGARLILLHVREMPLGVYGEFGAVPPFPTESEEQLREMLEQLELPDPSVHAERRVIDGDPAKVIVSFAKDQQCDLIVMATHGRTGLNRLLMGSVAEEVVRKAPCAVLTVKAASMASPPALKTTAEQPVSV